MNPARAKRLTVELQSKLLTYRLQNWRQVAAPNLTLDHFTTPTRELALSLATCIVGDDELRSQVFPLLEGHDRQIKLDRTSLLEALVLESLLAACHDSRSDTLPIGLITQSVNTILAGRGEALRVSPEVVGWKLRGLGMRTEFMADGRKGLVLLGETRVKIHALAVAYGVRTLQKAPSNLRCAHCSSVTI